MKQQKALVDREGLAELEIVPEHDIAAVDAIYPGFVDEVLDRVSARFEGKAAADGSLDEVRAHAAALVLSEVWEKRGGAAVNETVSARLDQAKSDAENWLADAPTVAAVRVSQRPAPFTPAAPVTRSDLKDGGAQ